MKLNPLISFVAAITVTALISGLVYLCFSLLNFNLAGGETLSQVENQNIVQLVISIILLLIALRCAAKYFKTGKKFTAYGIVLLPLLVVLAITFYIVEQNRHQAPFNKIVWARAKWKPDDMAKSLVKQKALLGMTRIQVKAMLGEGTEEYGDKNADRGSIVYPVQNGWTLSVIFQKDKVVETELRLPYLGI